MTEEERLGISRIILHCRMFEYGSSKTMTIFDYLGIIHPLGLNRPPEEIGYDSFAGIHLIYTMFLVDKKKDELMGGFIYKILKPLGHSDLLIPIQELIDTSLGPVTFGDFTRLQREKLCTHGDLSFASLEQHRDERMKKRGKQAMKVPSIPEAIERHNMLMERLISEVARLRESLEVIIDRANES